MKKINVELEPLRLDILQKYMFGIANFFKRFSFEAYIKKFPHIQQIINEISLTDTAGRICISATDFLIALQQ